MPASAPAASRLFVLPVAARRWVSTDNNIIDGKVQELNNRFDEVNIDLLICMASFSPTNSFAAFNAENMIKLAKLYPRDFEFEEMNQLPFQLN